MANLSNINNKFLVTTTGEVLIGGTAAIGAAKLQVTGEARVYTGSNLGYWGVDAGNSYVYLGTNSSAYGLSLQTGGIDRVNINDAGNVFISTPITNAFYGLSLTYNNTNTADFTVNQATGQIKIGGTAAGYFPTFYSAGTERMRIDSSGGVSITPTTSTSFFYGADGTNSYINFETNNIDATVQLYAGYSSGGYFAIGTKNSGGTLSEKMRIDSNGDVGIGETNVDARLHISALASNGISNVKLESPGASKWAFGIPAGQTYFALDDVNDNLTTPRLVVLKTSGNVGIGTDSPEDKLEVSGGALKIKASANHVEESYIKFGRIDQADGSYENHIKSVTGSGASQCKVTFSVCDTSATGRTNLLTLDGGNSRSIFQGNVGIGVTPTQKLDVDGLVKHKGLDMTTGIQVDQIATFNQTLTCLANTWTDTGVEGSDISSGHYMIGCYSNYYTSPPNWYNMYWTGTMAWYGGSSNGSFASDIFLNRVGHSDNGRTLELRTLIDYASIPKLQFKLNVSATNFTIRFIVRKLIS